jgi:hypothetical protein
VVDVSSNSLHGCSDSDLQKRSRKMLDRGFHQLVTYQHQGGFLIIIKMYFFYTNAVEASALNAGLDYLQTSANVS